MLSKCAICTAGTRLSSGGVYSLVLSGYVCLRCQAEGLMEAAERDEDTEPMMAPIFWMDEGNRQ
jgi:hypothetical protein